MEKGKVSFINKMITWCTLLFMPLSVYEVFISGFTLGDLFLMFTIILLMCNKIISKEKTDKFTSITFVLYIIYIIYNTALNFVITPSDVTIGLLSVSRYLFYLTFIILVTKRNLNQQYFYKWYKRLAIIFAIYSILQYVLFQMFTIVLPINILPLNPVDYIENLWSESTIHYFTSGLVLYRSYSVFIEPAYFAIFSIPILYLIIESKEDLRKKILMVFIILIGLILTASTTAYILIPICFIPTILRAFRKNISVLIFLLIGLIAVVFILMQIPTFENIVNRIVTTDGEVGTSITGRFENYSMIYNEDLSIKDYIFGKGIYYETDYLPSLGRLLVSLGITGTIIFASVLIINYIKLNKYSRTIILIFAISMIGTNILFNISSVLMFVLIFINFNENYDGKIEIKE